MQLNIIPIAFTIDSNYLLPASISIMSLVGSSSPSTFYDIYLLSGNLTLQEKQLLTSKIIDKQAKYKINWITVDQRFLDNVPTSKGWSKSVYFRLYLPYYLSEYDKVIYSDSDVVFTGDLSKVYLTSLDGYDWAGVIAEPNNEPLCHQYYSEYKNKNIYMSGFMIMNLKKMRIDKKIDSFFKNIQKHSKRLKMFDLEVLNLSCNKIKSIPFNYCVLENIYDEPNFRATDEYKWLSRSYSDEELIEAKKNPVVIHYAGKAIKVWKRPMYEIYDPYLSYIKLFKNEYRSLNKISTLKYMLDILPGRALMLRMVPEKYRNMPSIFISTIVHRITMSIPVGTRNKIKSVFLKNICFRRDT